MNYFEMLLIGYLGSILASCVSVLTYRLPRVLDLPYNLQLYAIAVPVSRCYFCDKKLSVTQLIPIFSFLLFRQTSCGSKIPLLYFVLEVVGFLLAIALFISLQQSSFVMDGLTLLAYEFYTKFALGLVFCFLLLAITMIDFKYLMIPDLLSVGLIWLGLLVNSFNIFVAPQNAVLGVILGYSFLFLIFYSYKLLKGKDALGFGDFKLLAAAGAWLGWQSLSFIVFLGSSLAIIYFIILFLIKKIDVNYKIPFGSFLAIAAIIIFLIRNFWNII